MYINSKMTMMFSQTTQIQQQRHEQMQIQQRQIQQQQQQQQALITTQTRTRGFRPMVLGQTNKKGCKSCGSA